MVGCRVVLLAQGQLFLYHRSTTKLIKLLMKFLFWDLKYFM